MKPKDLIIISIEETLLEALTQLGFTFSKSSLTFKRKVNEFVQTIDFRLNRNNQENVCAEFWTSFKVSSKIYLKWHKTEFGENETNDNLASAMDWNIEGWEFPVINNKKESHFQIINEKERENVLEILKKNILNVGIPYLNNLSNWENIAHHILENELFHYLACDFFLIAGKNDKALLALEKGLDYWKTKPNASFPDHQNRIQIRLAKYFQK